jgi:hypothetical protein
LLANGRFGRLKVFQSKIKLLAIGLLGFATGGGLLESGDQLSSAFRSAHPLRTSSACAAISIASGQLYRREDRRRLAREA